MIYGFTALHYGADYLAEAIRSVSSVVDKHYVIYTPKPSFGHGTKLTCPDTEEELRALAPDSVWIKRQFYNEGAQRDAIEQYLPNDTDLVVVVDADEVYGPHVEDAVDNIMVLPQNKRCKRWRVRGFHHLWKSSHFVCTDAMDPIRFIDYRGTRNEYGAVWCPVLHFGYAQSSDLMAYKWDIHGHKAELRKDYDWLKMYREWKMDSCHDVHPTCVGIWDPKPFRPETIVPDIVDHPLFGKMRT